MYFKIEIFFIVRYLHKTRKKNEILLKLFNILCRNINSIFRSLMLCFQRLYYFKYIFEIIQKIYYQKNVIDESIEIVYLNVGCFCSRGTCFKLLILGNLQCIIIVI